MSKYQGIMIEVFNNIFSKEQIEQAQTLYQSLTTEQRFWLSGYLSGLNQSGGLLNGSQTNHVNGNIIGNQNHVQELTILYGTHTGNSKLIGEQVSQLAEAKGIQVKLVAMPDYKLRQLKEEKNLLVIVSTHGEGEPPVSAEDFYSYLFGKKAPKSDHINFGVIGLGDSSYINFCKTGKDIFSQLKKLGGTEVHDIIELDVDFKDHLPTVLPGLVDKFVGVNGYKVNGEVSLSPQVASSVSDEWVEVEVLEKVLLNGKGSKKETYHIELDIEDTGLVYEPGDALEVKAVNKESFVLDILSKLSISADEQVEKDGALVSIREALVNGYELTVLTLPVLKKYTEIAQNSELNTLLEDQEKLQQFLYGSDFLDLLNAYPVQLDASKLLGLLRKLPARLYSISSSYEFNPDEVHITVGAVRYNLNDREHHGVCSGFLADHIQIGGTVWVRVKKNEGFRLPADSNSKVIMIGPGTGIAPFRGFLQQREAVEANGENWIFFGDQHFETDFLYQTELLKYRDAGLLNQISVAFSRDQEEKVYVQHKIRKHGAKFYQWIKEGAHIYLCGDMNRMAKDVKKEIVGIIEEHGKISTREAADYFKKLKVDKRFQEDVY